MAAADETTRHMAEPDTSLLHGREMPKAGGPLPSAGKEGSRLRPRNHPTIVGLPGAERAPAGRAQDAELGADHDDGEMMTEDGVVRDGIKRGDAVVVTGGGGGFGRAFSRRFARAGARVAVWDVDSKAGEEIVRDIGAEGGEASFVEADLCSSAAIEAAVALTLKIFGAPYCIINNASIFPRASLIDMAPEVWERTLKVNITAPFLIMRAFGPHMIAQKRGVVINIASGRGLEGAVNGAGYACSKAAILSLTKSLALEWAKHNVRVNAIIPGVSLTAQPLGEGISREELIERGRKTIPLGRVGYPDDMAGLAAFLASADAAYMTGQGVAMNGGRILVP
jgi:NAD(P)-dependent dehydrogenase (short-subunit alcohol dehydrogenase family)